MKRFTKTSFFVLFTAFLHLCSGQYNDLPCLDLSKCVTLLKDLTNEEEMHFAHNEKELEDLCQKLKEAVSCVNAFTAKCLDQASQLQYMVMTNGTQKLINQLCTNGTPFRTEYLKHAECYRHLTNDYKTCAEQYYSTYEKLKDIQADEDQETQIMKWCCNFDSHRECTYNAVLLKCGRNAANLAENIVITAGGILVEVHCKNYTYNSPLCTPVTRSFFRNTTNRTTPAMSLQSYLSFIVFWLLFLWKL